MPIDTRRIIRSSPSNSTRASHSSSNSLPAAATWRESGVERPSMIYIVDGTGELSDKDYARSNAGSHCMRTHYLNKASSFYWRGPDLSDLIKRTASIAEKVHAEVLRNEFPPTLLAPGARQLPKTPI